MPDPIFEMIFEYLTFALSKNLNEFLQLLMFGKEKPLFKRNLLDYKGRVQKECDAGMPSTRRFSIGYF